MITLNTTLVRRFNRALAKAVLLFGILCMPAFAGAEELPTFLPGMWEFNLTTGNGRRIEVRRCTDPTENVLQKKDCKISSIKKSGNIYTFVADLPERPSSSPALGGRTKVVLEVKSDRFYQVVSEGMVDGHPVKEYLDARRRGDCRK